MIRRRTFIAGGFAASVAPLAAEAQPAPSRRVGFLAVGSVGTTREWIEAFANRLRELGWIEGRNIAVAYGYADGRRDRFEELTADFVLFADLKGSMELLAGVP